MTSTCYAVLITFGGQVLVGQEGARVLWTAPLEPTAPGPSSSGASASFSANRESSHNE